MRLNKIDIENELEQHKLLDEFNEWLTAKSATKKELFNADSALKSADNHRISIVNDLEQLKNKNSKIIIKISPRNFCQSDFSD